MPALRARRPREVPRSAAPLHGARERGAQPAGAELVGDVRDRGEPRAARAGAGRATGRPRARAAAAGRRPATMPARRSVPVPRTARARRGRASRRRARARCDPAAPSSGQRELAPARRPLGGADDERARDRARRQAACRARPNSSRLRPVTTSSRRPPATRPASGRRPRALRHRRLRASTATTLTRRRASTYARTCLPSGRQAGATAARAGP